MHCYLVSYDQTGGRIMQNRDYFRVSHCNHVNAFCIESNFTVCYGIIACGRSTAVFGYSKLCIDAIEYVLRRFENNFRAYDCALSMQGLGS